MAARFVNVDHETPLLLPPDIRDWVPADHLVHFVMDAVGQLDLQRARVNERGTGDEQYPPGMMLGLLIYSYATGVFSSRQTDERIVEIAKAAKPERRGSFRVTNGDGKSRRTVSAPPSAKLLPYTQN